MRLMEFLRAHLTPGQRRFVKFLVVGASGVPVNLGVVFLATGSDKAAVDSLTRGIELDPENGTGAFNLANALIRLNRLHEAGYYLKRFIVDGQEKGHDLVEPAKRILENLQRLIINEERAKAGG